MRYLKTYEEVNLSKLNPFKKDDEKMPNILLKRQEIEDCLQDLMDIGECKSTVRDARILGTRYIGKKYPEVVLIYEFNLRNSPMAKEQSDDYNSEIFGRIKDIDVNIQCYHDRWYSSKDDYPSEMEIKKITFAFSYYKLKQDQINRILYPWRYIPGGGNGPG